MTRSTLPLPLAALFTLSITISLAPSPASARKLTGEAEACKKCHAKVFKGKHLHGPIEAGKCTACHKAKGKIPTGKHPKKFFEVRRDANACLSCHRDVAKTLAKGTMHPPVKKHGCTKCHNTHSSDQKFLLAHKTPAEQCKSCHKNTKLKFAYVHGPVAAGACTVCHDPHAGKGKLMLVATGKDLCFACHDAARFKTKFKHAALKKGCDSCHSAHGSSHKYFVRDKTKKLCGKCHQKILKIAEKAKVKHKAIEKAGCASCHDPHGSKYGKLMKAHPLKVCTICHKAAIDGKYKHGPVAEGSCGDCHKPHGGDNARMLVEPFPTAFYGEFSTKRYALCFECHEEDITKDKYTTTLTGFRDGKRNLHYLHVVAPGNRRDKGRSCRACHQVHSGPQPKQIREKVPFGKSGWELPVTFTKSKDGGKCEVGCHSPKTYRRSKK